MKKDMKKRKKMVLVTAATTIMISAMLAGCASTTDSAASKDTAMNASVCETGETDTTGAADTTGTADTAESVQATAAASTETGSVTTSADFVNSYDNTDELSKKFPVTNETPINDEMGKKMENRLLTGFENWNRGYKAWQAWGNILYTKDSIYNVHGVRLTLSEYQAAMNAALSQINIQMGKFNNMIICDDWAAIHYNTVNISHGKSTPSSVMEFVHFKDYGKELGVRVEEGWGGTKNDGAEAMSMFQTAEEKKAQQEATDAILSYQIPKVTDLEKKYPVKNPTSEHSDMADAIKQAILKDFDSWNQGYNTWSAAADDFYTTDAEVNASNGSKMLLNEYKDYVKNTEKTTNIQKLYFDNMLISGEWAAIHYRYTNEDLSTKKKNSRRFNAIFPFRKRWK